MSTLAIAPACHALYLYTRVQCIHIHTWRAHPHRAAGTVALRKGFIKIV